MKTSDTAKFEHYNHDDLTPSVSVCVFVCVWNSVLFLIHVSRVDGHAVDRYSWPILITSKTSIRPLCLVKDLACRLYKKREKAPTPPLLAVGMVPARSRRMPFNVSNAVNKLKELVLVQVQPFGDFIVHFRYSLIIILIITEI